MTLISDMPERHGGPDLQGITDMVYLYAEAVDILGNSPPNGERSDEGLAAAAAVLATCMTRDAVVDLFLAGPDGPASRMSDRGPVAFARAVRDYFTAYAYVGTHHHAGNIRVAFEAPDRAAVSSIISCYHWLADGKMLLTPVRYTDEAVRTNGVWKIAGRKIYATRFWIAEGYAPDPLDPTLSKRV